MSFIVLRERNAMKPSTAEARSVKELIAMVKRGAHPKYVFFWGHKPKVPGRLDQSCLSNWFPAAFVLEGMRYPTTEHYIMAEKARLFGDEACLKEILESSSPGKAKQIGRKVSGFSEDVWVRHRFDIVVRGSLGKFKQHEDMGRLLRTTGTKVLVEASPRDRIWGIGMGASNERVEDPARWRGQNLLGFALMEVRSQL
jgi:ribA/ribD-fused uncharacterized protein